MKIMKFLLFIATFQFCLMANASNALRGKRFTTSIQNQKSKELIINKKFVTKGREAFITKKDLVQIIPTDMSPTNDGELVQNRILSKAAQFLSNTPMIKNSFFMKTAKKVENETKIDLNVKASQGEDLLPPIEHKFNFDIQAFKGEARLLYSGLIDSKLEYKTANNTVQFSLEEQLSKTSKIALSHEKNNLEQRQLLQYQIQW